MMYQIRKNGRVLGVVRAPSASDAIESFVEEQFPDDPEAAGWKTRDFLRYTLTAKRVPGTERQFQLQDLMWLFFLVALALGIYVNWEALHAALGWFWEELTR